MTIKNYSVVIPTIAKRKLELVEAIQSASAQSLQPDEILIVFDGAKEDIPSWLVKFEDRITKVLCTGRSSNANVARNLGARNSNSSFIAFLDDDDVWESHKAETQLRRAVDEPQALQFISCNVSLFGEVSGIWPSRPKRDDEPIGDYLFNRERWGYQAHFIQTSGWFVSRKLFEICSFDPDLSIHQDLDYLIRLFSQTELIHTHVDESLVRYRVGAQNSVSRSAKYETSLKWIKSLSGRVSEKNRAEAMLMLPFNIAVSSGSLEEAKEIYAAARGIGEVSVKSKVRSHIKLFKFRLSAIKPNRSVINK